MANARQDASASATSGRPMVGGVIIPPSSLSLSRAAARIS